jgi:hypothetical protein
MGVKRNSLFLFGVGLTGLLAASCDIVLHVEGSVYSDSATINPASAVTRVKDVNAQPPPNSSPIEGATVTVTHQRGTETVVSDQYGHFVLRVTTSYGPAVIRCEKQGYLPTEYKRSSREAPPILLQFILRPVK